MKNKILVNWPAEICLIIGIIFFSCMLIFDLHIFEEWNITEITFVEKTNDPASRIVTYCVDDKIYTQKVHYYVNGNAPVPGTPGQGQYFIEYLVNNPTKCIYARREQVIVFLSADCLLILLLVPSFFIWNKYLNKKQNKKLNCEDKENVKS